MWHVHNEYGWANAHCYCETSAEAFRDWLRDRHGSVAALNRAWGTTFWGLSYGSFDEVEPPRLAPPGLLTALQLDFMRFSVDAHIANFRRERDIIRRHCDLPVTTNWTRRSGETAMAQLLERSPDLDAVFVASDLMAAGALATLRAAGREVPDDVAVGGFDDSSVAVSTHPPLTTVRRPLAQVAEETVRLLLDLIDGAPHVDSVILPTTLVVRASA